MRVALLIISGFTLIASLVVTTATHAQQGVQQNRPQPIPIPGQTVRSLQAELQNKGEDPAFKGITLTQAQKTQIDEIRAKYRDKRKEQRIAARKAEFAAGKAAYGKGARIQFKPINVSALNAQQRAEIRSVLSQQQRTVLDRNVADLPKK